MCLEATVPNLRPKLPTFLALIVAACTSQSEPLAPRAQKPSLDASQAVVSSASGGGIVGFSAIAGASDGHFTFNAYVTGDGRAHGRFHQRRSRAGLLID